MHWGYRSRTKCVLCCPQYAKRIRSEQVCAARAASFRAVNMPALCYFPEVFYGVRNVLMGVKMKISALEYFCIVLAIAVAVAGFAEAASALISVI